MPRRNSHLDFFTFQKLNFCFHYLAVLLQISTWCHPLMLPIKSFLFQQDNCFLLINSGRKWHPDSYTNSHFWIMKFWLCYNGFANKTYKGQIEIVFTMFTYIIVSNYVRKMVNEWLFHLKSAMKIPGWLPKCLSPEREYNESCYVLELRSSEPLKVSPYCPPHKGPVRTALLYLTMQ